MIPEKVFQKILVLGDGWQVQQVDYVEKESKVLTRIEEICQIVLRIQRLALQAAPTK
jgi:hypothetical protein